MVENHLTDEMKQAGEYLVQKMDEAGINADAAFWLYEPDSQGWKLVIAEARVGKSGPRESYRKVQELLGKFSGQIKGISLDDISLITPTASIVTLLRQVLRTGPGISGIRFKHNVINGTLIEDAYIYRLS